MKKCKFLFAEMLLLLKKQTAENLTDVQGEINGNVNQEDFILHADSHNLHDQPTVLSDIIC